MSTHDPELEAQRLAVLKAHRILDSLPEQAYDDIAQLAAQSCASPIAIVSLIGATRVWFKATVGLPEEFREVPRADCFCEHVIQTPDRITVIADIRDDPHFADNRFVNGEPHIRFYAGAPIVTASGIALGVVSVLDRVPRELSDSQLNCLHALARQVVKLLEARHHAEQQAQLASDAVDQAHTDNEYLQALSTVALDLKAVVDLNYRYRHVNAMYLNYWQKSRDEVEGLTIAELVGENWFVTEVQPKLDRALRGESVTFDTCFDFPVLGTRHTRVTYLPARDKGGGIIGAVVRIEDITDLKQIEWSLRRSLQMLEEKNLALQRFIHILSHDLREPVNTIINFTGLLHELLPDDVSALRYVGFISEGGTRLRMLLDDLLAYVQMENLTITTRSVALQDVYGEVKVNLHDVIGRSQAELSCDELPMINGEHTLLRVLLQDLVSNAIKFVAPGVQPKVNVAVVQHADAWELKVIDNGIGIPVEHHEAVFDLFKRLHSQRHYEGTGLGLATCRRVAQLHGGKIWVTAEPLGGSCFHVLLPTHQS
jgi:signal transduction histidine kinase